MWEVEKVNIKDWNNPFNFRFGIWKDNGSR